MRQTLAITAVLATCLAVILLITRPWSQDDASPTPALVTPPPPAAKSTALPYPEPGPAIAVAGPADPATGLKPGETRPGSRPDTILVKPLGPGAPKEIPRSYRVPASREDARITRTDAGEVVFNEAIALAEQLHDPKADPAEDLNILNAILGFYRLVYQSNPVAGENLDVASALTGHNPHKVVVFPKDHPALDDKGQLNDRWGSPYFFHALSATQLDIWSAGPDKQRGTGDDLKLGLE